MPAHFPRWTDLRLPRRQPSTTADYRALQMALRLTAAALVNECMGWDHRPIPGDTYATIDWLRQALAPLAARSAEVAAFVRLLDLDAPRQAWMWRARLGRHLRYLARDVVHLATTMPPPRRQRSSRRRA